MSKELTGKIIWDNDVHPNCCPGQIINADDESETLLIQNDWDCPGVATSFGWSIQEVQKKVECEHEDSELCGFECDTCDLKPAEPHCEHSGTDGTVDCKECGLTALDFINAAERWLRDNDGAEADDPGYFG
jgi:hypothetical protein